jgi:phosphate transport system substrate-binding protein
LAVVWSEDFKKIHPNVRFNISAGGAGKGIADVLTGMVDIGMVSRDLHEQEIKKELFRLLLQKMLLSVQLILRTLIILLF